MSAGLSGRRALVTGGAVRVGRALCRELAGMGLDVAVHHRSCAAAAEETAARCREAGGRAVVVGGDLSSAAGCRAVVADAAAALGGLEVLVNSAADFTPTSFADTTEEEFDRALAVNLKGPFFCAQAAAPHMLAAGFGRIVNLADVAALEPWPRFAVHCASKAGVVMLTRSLAQELAPTILVNAIAPGAVLMPDGASASATGRAAGKTVLERVGSPDDVAGALRYLLEADYVTGHTLVVDGGRLVRP